MGHLILFYFQNSVLNKRKRYLRISGMKVEYYTKEMLEYTPQNRGKTGMWYEYARDPRKAQVSTI